MAEITIHNPILPGFNPDPSICRVGDDFYIATSTFEWFPGVQIHQSRNLRDWKLIGRPLDRVNQLDMVGVPSSGGIWAPDLSYYDSLFYLVYTNVHSWRSEEGVNFADTIKDTPNYLVTASSIAGPWSDPVYLNSSGFDPSLFHDDDGKKYLVNMLWDYRINRNNFAGIVLQEYDVVAKKLVGEKFNICIGTEIAFTEGPHLLKRNGWYYLIVAEGGTSYGHAESMFRSKHIKGPYEAHPSNPIISSVKGNDRDILLSRVNVLPWRELTDTALPTHWYDYPQKAGHASMCELAGDEWVLVHLMGRPLLGTAHCPLGRETGIQRVYWKQDWVYMHDTLPVNSISIPQELLPQATNSKTTQNHSFRDDFKGKRIHKQFQYSRSFLDERHMSLKARKGFLRLSGAESPLSVIKQSIIAHRVQSFNFVAKTQVEMFPDSFQHFAGLFVKYDERNQVLLRISKADNGKKTLGFIVYDRGRLLMPIVPDADGMEIAIPDGKIDLQVEMRIEGRSRLIQFSWGQSGTMHTLPQVFDPAKYSDEYTWPMGFTGMFVGIGCFDCSGERNHADFSFYEYNEV